MLVSDSDPWEPMTGHVGTAKGCTRGSSVWTSENIYLMWGWSNTGTGSLERWMMLRACQSLRGIWIMTLITCFSFFRANLKKSGQAVGLVKLSRSLWTSLYSVLFVLVYIQLVICKCYLLVPLHFLLQWLNKCFSDIQEMNSSIVLAISLASFLPVISATTAFFPTAKPSLIFSTEMNRRNHGEQAIILDFEMTLNLQYWPVGVFRK